MAEVILESRVQVVLEGLSFTCSVEEAEELRDLLLEQLPVEREVVQFGFGPSLEVADNE